MKKPKKGQRHLGWKYCRSLHGYKPLLVRLAIPARAKHVHFTGKSRASEAKVIAIYQVAGGWHRGYKKGRRLKTVVGRNAVYGSGTRLEYKIGTTVYPDQFNPDKAQTCSHGIHYHFRIKDALSWVA